MVETVVRLVDDLVDGEGCGLAVRVLLVPFSQFRGDPVQPLVQHRAGPRVQGRKAADDAGLALGDHKLRIGDDEKRRSDNRDAQILENGG